jgi:anaerobic ribonucleoside-triphosphate reductase activating protein
MSVSGLIDWIFSIECIDGITISGGEPTDQMPSLISLLHDIRYLSDLSVILFSGRTMREIECMHRGRELLSLIDVLIDGPYDLTKANPPGVWPASANQNICLLTGRYSPRDFAGIPPFEVFIGRKGGIVVSGMGDFTGSRVLA